MATEEFSIHRSRSGLPCLWERGGGATNTGFATVVADPEGRPKPPLYIARRGSLAGGNHALVPVAAGDVVVTANHHRDDFVIRVWRLTRIDGNSATAEVVAEYGEGEWSPPLPAHLQDAVEAAMKKATCYHCRSPHYVAE